MRLLTALALGSIGAISTAGACMAQIPLHDQYDDIAYGRLERVNPLTFADIVVKQQYERFHQFNRDVYSELIYNQPLIRTADLADPYTSSVANQAGYYRVTVTEPPLELVEPLLEE
ncbi:MAG: hypothetical protein AAF974_09075 [Cyanobacteria bacterium P01_E01_bin.34]